MRVNGRYELHETVGSGGMGLVCRGVDTQTGQSVAVKLLKAEAVAEDPQMVERFIREGEALRQLNHPNIVRALDTAVEDGQHYLVMEYVAGGSLRDELGRGPLPVERALQIALDLADALTRAHRLNIIHRDLKPANVLISEDGTPRLTDFGIARLGAKERVTSSNALIGTLDYLAPEALSDSDIDPRADIWAFGAMLFEMLTGVKPFNRPAAASTLSAILFEAPPDLEALRPDCPTALADLIYRMLEKDRDARIPSVRLVGAEVEALLRGDTPASPAKQAAAPTGDPATLVGDKRFATPTPTERPNHNLPAQTTPFVGREHELAELAKLLDNPQVRLVTILAPGGMGKTRLALEAARAALEQSATSDTHQPFANGAYFVSLAPLAAPESIVTAIAEAVSFQFYGGGDPKQQLLDFLREKRLLLVLDNFEHLLAGVPLVGDILEAAPGVKALATSRERLNLSGETPFNLGGLDLPEGKSAAAALEYSAVRLFVQGAGRAQPGFELRDADVPQVARICRLVAGMPLGLLLAASWMEMLSPAEIAAEIENSLDFLEANTRDLPERQRSLRAVFNYSWNLLTEAEQAVFAWLSVFRGGFTRQAAEAVAGANLRNLMALVNKSLLRRDPARGRYQFHELLRQYAAERLEQTGEGDAARDAHSVYYADFLDERKDRMISRTQKQTIAEMSAEMENALAAWEWAVEQRHIASMNKSLRPLAGMAENLSQFREWAERFRAAALRLGAASDEQTGLLIARLRLFYGYLAGRMGDFDTMRATGEETLPLFRGANSKPDVMLALQDLAIAAGSQGRYAEAQQYSGEILTLARELDDRPSYYFVLSGLAWGQFEMGRSQEARQMFEQELSGVDALGVPIIMALYRQELGQVLHALNEDEAAKKRLEEALVISQDLGNRRMTAYIFTSLGNVAHSLGSYPEAQRYYQESLATHRDIGDRVGTAEALGALGGGFWALGEYRQAKQCHQEALAIYREVGDIRGMANALALTATTCGVLGEYAEARTCLEECLALRRKMGNPADMVDGLGHFVRLENFIGDYEAAMRWSEQLFQYREQADSIPAFWGHYAGNRIDTLVKMGAYQEAIETLDSLKSRFPADQIPSFVQTIMLNRRGWAQRELGHLAEAERDLRESLRIAEDLHSPGWQIVTVLQFGALFGAQGQAPRAVELLSFVRESHYTPYADKLLASHYLEPLQTALPPEVFAAAIERGRALDLDTVVADLLADQTIS
jgi:predicted ATPase